MKLQFTPIFYPVDMGNSAPMTESESKIFIGIWLIMNIIWFISLIPFSIRSFKNLRIDYFNDRVEHGELWMFFDVIMVFVWVIILLVLCGIFVSKFL